MKLVKWIVLILATSGLGIGCSGFLEERSQDEVIPSTVTDYREILLYYEQAAFGDALFVLDDDAVIDESHYPTSGSDFANAVAMEGVFTWQPDMWERTTSLSDNYNQLYENIKAMNTIIELIDDAEGDEEERQIVKAQALGTRAYYYFLLVNMFGEPYNFNKDALGVVLKLNSPYQEKGMSRSTVAEVYDQIVEDLETASVILNNYPKQRGNHLMNNTAADILLSRVYLYMEEWEKAEEAANRAIGTAEGLTNYTILPEDSHFYMTSYDNAEVEWIFCSCEVPYDVLASNDLMFLYQENDRRKDFVMKTDAYNYTSIVKVLVDGRGPNVMVRSAEAYLNRAEAKVLKENPDLDGALADLNELRRHRITGYEDVSITNDEELLEEIRKERRMELCFEGHRWFDLRRYGMPSISHDFRRSLNNPLLRYTLREKDPLYTLPFPKTALENNVSLEQNPAAMEPERSGTPIE